MNQHTCDTQQAHAVIKKQATIAVRLRRDHSMLTTQGGFSLASSPLCVMARTKSQIV